MYSFLLSREGKKHRSFLIKKKDFFKVNYYSYNSSLSRKNIFSTRYHGLFPSCGSHRKSVFSFMSGTASELCRRNCSTVFRIQSPATFLQPPQQAKRLRHRITPTTTQRPRIWERERKGEGRQKTNQLKYENFSFFFLLIVTFTSTNKRSNMK